MKGIYKKIFLAVLFAAILLLSIYTESDAATAGISASSTKVNVGDSVNINVSVNAATWNVKVNGSGISDSIVGVNTDVENQTTNKSYKLDTSKAGTYTVKLTGDITDADGTSQDISKNQPTVTVTVEEKTTEPVVEPKKEEEPKNGSTTTTGKSADTPKQEPQKTAEPAFKEVNETVYVNPEKVSSVNVRQGYTTSTTLVGSIKAGESVTRTGIGDNGWSRIKYNGQTAYVISSALTTEKPEEKEETSTNKALKELSIKGYELSPAFDAETTSYSITLKEDEKKLDITATAADEKAKVEITGNDNLENPNNTVRITVTAEDGTQRIYRISVLKNEETRVVEMVKLKSLQVANATLSPEFDPDTVSYVIEVENPSSITAKDVVATAEDDDVNVTIAEASESSENGEKKITIVLESKDGSVSTTYEIFVKKPVANHLDNLMQNKSDKTIYMILGGIIAVLVILIIVIIILLKKTGDRDDGDETEMDGADEMSDDYDYSLKNAIDEVNRGEDTEYDDMLKESRAKTQILSMDYNVFKDASDDVGLGQDKDEVEEDDDGNVEEDDDLEIKPKKRGKHF